MKAGVPVYPMMAAGNRRGGTLVEVMIGIVILGILAVTGAMYLAESRGTLAVQRNKTTALLIAGGQLEALCGTSYMSLTNRLVGGIWTTNGTVMISGMSMPMQATLGYVDIDGVTGPDAMRARVEVQYRSGNSVALETLLAP